MDAEEDGASQAQATQKFNQGFGGPKHASSLGGVPLAD